MIELVDNDSGLYWKNPCPDASVPMVPSGIFGTINCGYVAPLATGGAQAPSIPKTIMVSAIPTLSPISASIDTIRQEYTKVLMLLNDSFAEVQKLKVALAAKDEQLQIVTKKHTELSDKLQKIKASL